MRIIERNPMLASNLKEFDNFNQMRKMILLQVIASIFLVIASNGWAGRDKFVRRVTLQHGSDPVFVPKGKIWKLEKLSPYISEKGIGTADVYVTGQICVGGKKDYTLYGKFDVLINEKSFPI
ncbi:MAG: hypothetical protein M3Y82_01460, partial [Verrucomicrobiota bacterium]|nr:hypothetical protein [Verrucomicrobiota bacterium]